MQGDLWVEERENSVQTGSNIGLLGELLGGEKSLGKENADYRGRRECYGANFHDCRTICGRGNRKLLECEIS